MQALIKPINPQTTKIFTPVVSYSSFMKVDLDYSIPVINSIKQENEIIREQIAHVSAELPKLAKLTEGLLEQNQQLRMHYGQRNVDLQNLVQTIQINIAKEMEDLQHQIYLLKEGNCLNFKSIEKEGKEIGEHNQRIVTLKNRLNSLTGQTVDKDENVLMPLKVRLKNKLNSNFTQRLQKNQTILTNKVESLQKQVCDLVLEVNQITRENFKNGKKTLEQKNQNNENKEECKNGIIQTFKTLAQAKADKQTLIDEIHDIENQTRQLEVKLKQVLTKQSQQVKKKQKKATQLAKLKHRKDEQCKNLNETKQCISTLQISGMNKNQERQRLQNKIRNKKRQIEESKNKFGLQKQRLKNECKQNIQQIKKKKQRDEQTFNQEIAQLRKLLEIDQRQINNLEEQFNSLCRDVEDYEETVRKFDNNSVVRQTEKLKSIQRMGFNRSPLGALLAGN